MTNLSNLPPEMMLEIAKKLKKLEDFTSFTSVSKSLRLAAEDKCCEGIRLRQRTPCLMLPVTEGNDDTREFYSLVEDESIVASVKVANFKDNKCLESLGWLMTSYKDGSMCLLDPFSGTEIPLPHQHTFPGYDHSEMDEPVFFEKMVLSARPSETSDFVLMVIGGGFGYLAYWRLGDNAWNRIEDRKGQFTDVVYHGGGLFYAVGYPGLVWAVNFSSDDNQIMKGCVVASFVPKDVTREGDFYVHTEVVINKHLYIVKTVDGLLLMITRALPILGKDNFSFITNKFNVYQVDVVAGTWKEIHSLGSMAVFLGHNSSIAVDASRYPGTVIKANHIYFTDDNYEVYYFDGPKDGGGVDSGVFNMETGVVEPIYPGEVLCSKVSPSTWLTPCF